MRGIEREAASWGDRRSARVSPTPFKTPPSSSQSLITTLNSMPTPDLPTEIWSYIFSFACMDDGRTGCALQRVSKHFRDLSKYSRFTSVCLYRSKDIVRFKAAITPLPRNERRVRYLHITTPHLFLDVPEEEEDGDYEISDSESSFDNVDNTFSTEGNPGHEAEMGNVEMYIDESGSDDDEYRSLSTTEASEVHDIRKNPNCQFLLISHH
jgi:hypothetical protein